MCRKLACASRIGAGISLFLFGGMMALAGQKRIVVPPQQTPPDSEAQQTPASKPEASSSPASGPSAQAASAAPDHAASYYHYMLARRYSELAGIYNRSDYVDKAISEYQQAIQADPDSLFLKVQLAELYWRVSRVGDAVAEVQKVLKVNPDDLDAHQLLAHIYVTSLGESQTNAASQGSSGEAQGFQETLHKAIHEYQEVIRLDPEDMHSALFLGRLYKLNNQPDKAEAIFKKAVEGEPNSRSAVVQLAQIYADQGQYRDAIDLLKKIPDEEMDSGLLGLLGSAYAHVGEGANAEAAYEKALKLEPENEDVRRAYAETLMSNGKTDEARAQLKTILKNDPQDASTYVRLAHLDRQEGRFDDAASELEHAKSLDPTSNEVAYEQAILDDVIGKDDQAIQVINQWLQRTEKPAAQYTEAEAVNRAAFLQLLGRIYSSEEKYDQAIDAFKQVLALGGDEAPSGEGLIAETLRLKHEPSQALMELNAAIEKYPKNRALLEARAKLLGQQGHVKEAVSKLQDMLTGSPTDQEIYLAIADVYSTAKQYPAAEVAVKKALALIPNPGDQEFARFMLGSVYERQKKYDLAEEEFKKVLAQDPFNDAAANYLGYMLADQGVQLKQSLDYIQKAVKLEPNNGAYLDSLGWAYYKMKRYEQARAPLEKAVQLISDDPTIREHLGYVYLGLGKRDLAVEQWEQALKLWPKSLSSDFGPADAAKLRKELDSVKVELARKKSSTEGN
jgi:tetratricopeptide (TPR) repeat protein